MLNFHEFLNVIKYGILGFFIFFGVLIFAKFLNSVLVSKTGFLIEGEDVLLSMLGFVYMVFIRSIEKFRKSNSFENLK